LVVKKQLQKGGIAFLAGASGRGTWDS
jgi:hypothetical protein